MKTIGLISCLEAPEALSPLLQGNPLAALPFGGAYRMVDFPLSAMASVSAIGLFGNCGPLAAHIGTGRAWSMQRTPGGISLLFSMEEDRMTAYMKFPAAALSACLDFIRGADAVLLAGCGMAAVPELQAMENMLEVSEADAVLLYAQDMAPHGSGYCVRRCGDGFFTLERCCYAQQDQFLDYLLIRPATLCRLLASGHGDLLELLCRKQNSLRMAAVPHCGFAAAITDLGSYLSASRAMLRQDVRSELFSEDDGLRGSAVLQEPVRYLPNAAVHNASLGSGCTIAGTVTGSVLFENVRIGSRSEVRDSVLLPGCTIGADCRLRNVICAPSVVLSPGLELAGQDCYPFVLGKKQRY